MTERFDALIGKRLIGPGMGTPRSMVCDYRLAMGLIDY
jgi:hypothetical protein